MNPLLQFLAHIAAFRPGSPSQYNGSITSPHLLDYLRNQPVYNETGQMRIPDFNITDNQDNPLSPWLDRTWQYLNQHDNYLNRQIPPMMAPVDPDPVNIFSLVGRSV